MLALALLATGCAAGSAFNEGESAMKLGQP